MELSFIDKLSSVRKFLLKIFVSLCILLAFDMCYFKFAGNIHDTVFKLIKPSTKRGLRLPSALLAWSLLAVSVSLLNPKKIKDAIIYGFFSGFLIYGVYNATNYATIKAWTVPMSIVDTMWGTFLCTIVSVITFYIFGKNYYT